MSKIEDALRKFQKERTPRDPEVSGHSTGRATQLPDSVVPIARNKKFIPDGEKHHLDQNRLIQLGILAPVDTAVAVMDQFRRIKRPILENISQSSLRAEDQMNLILVTSALPGAGKTFCSVNLAASISLERELNVLLVDADVAKQHISVAFGLNARRGLIDILEDESYPMDDVLVRTDWNDIQVLPSGNRHSQSTELLASDRMAFVMTELSNRYPDRVIVIDSPPLLITSEAQALARQVGQIVMVVESGKTHHSEVREALEVLDRNKPINVILNKSTYSQSGDYYGNSSAIYGFNEQTD